MLRLTGVQYKDCNLPQPPTDTHTPTHIHTHYSDYTNGILLKQQPHCIRVTQNQMFLFKIAGKKQDKAKKEQPELVFYQVFLVF